jgi:hypothetical protein
MISEERKRQADTEKDKPEGSETLVTENARFRPHLDPNSSKLGKYKHLAGDEMKLTVIINSFRCDNVIMVRFF